MFYEVKVLDGNGKVKKVISPKKLSDRFWQRHEMGQDGGMEPEDLGDDLNLNRREKKIDKSPIEMEDS